MFIEFQRARAALFSITAVACCGLFILPWTKIVLDLNSLLDILPSVTLIFGLCIYLHRRGMVMLRGLTEVMGCAVLISCAGIVWSYAAISFASPLADRRLMAFDSLLGFDWPAFASVIDRIPWLEATLFAAYQSFMYQLVMIPLLLVALGFALRGYLLLAGFGLLCMSASIISIWFPALGAHVAYGIDPATLKNLNPHFAYAFLEQFHAVRNDESFRLSVDKAAGILTFPSIHAGMALLWAWSAWESRLLRVPVALLNVAMAVSAISHGSHYLVDVVAGMGLATGIVLVLDLLIRRRIFSRRESFSPSCIR